MGRMMTSVKPMAESGVVKIALAAPPITQMVRAVLSLSAIF
ncbi:MAG: hypothetical protein PG978_000723 [Wolbachia endosymbiont of Ctenocephalides felis wCfeF]|nr:MAG: hypothetical protein PG978_000723 [Wolbachia endosymbiont of Ctenocephalides felis wCfeF]